MGGVSIWAMLRLFGTGAFDGLLRGLSAAWKWITSDWRNGPLVWFIGMWLVNALIITPTMQRRISGLAGELASTEAMLEATQLAHLGTIANYIDASAQAKRDAEANAARVKAEQEVITHEVTRDLRSDLAAVSARFDRLRARNAAASHPGGADAADLPGTGDAAGRAAGAAPDQDLRLSGDLSPKAYCPAELVCLTIAEAEEASQDAHRHDRLIDWVTGQYAVRFTPEGDR